MATFQEGSAVASTSKQPLHPSLPARPTSHAGGSNSNGKATRSQQPQQQSDFKQQDDFISFTEILSDDDAPPSHRGKGKGREQPNGFRGKKRTIGEVLDGQGKRKLKDIEKTTPWTLDVDWDAHASATQQLSAEIKAFAKYISPTDQEHELRTCVVESIRRLITQRWRDATVHAFGSFETRLYLPTGDIDLVIISPSISREKSLQKKTLFMLSSLLKSSRIGKDIIVIAKARVPIVKFVTVQGDFKVDISLNMLNGIQVGKRVTQLFKEVGEEPARALIMVTKAFLSQRSMNEVFSGGLGSYSIICLVVSFLQLHPKLQRKEMIAIDNMGTLLLEFLELYGKHFNFEEVGICVSGGGSYYSKSRRGWLRPNQPYLLSIEDPADPTNDVAGGSHNIRAVQRSLSGAFELLSYAVYVRTSIILARISSAQSGRQLPTLSGRAIPHAAGEDDEALDECHKSLLGALVGVTADIESSRRAAKKLAEYGDVQRFVGVKPGIFDEDGMLFDPKKAKPRPPSTTPPPSPPPPPPPQSTSKAKASAVARPAEPSILPQTVPPPGEVPAKTANGAQTKVNAEKPTNTAARPRQNSRSQPYVEIPLRRTSTAKPSSSDKAANKSKANGATTPKDEKTSAQTNAQDLLKSTRPNAQPAISDSAAKETARTYIELDSPTPSPPPERPSLLRRNSSRHDSDDSRYGVKKPKNKPSHATSVLDQTDNRRLDDDSSSSDSDIVFVSVGKAQEAGASKSLAPPTPPASGPSLQSRSRSNRKSGTPKPINGTSSDMDVQSNSSSGEGRSTKATSSRRPSRKKASQRKGTSPQKLTAMQRQEYWKAKGQGSGHNASSDSDSDTVYVRSR